jgi:Na+/H+-translocating membrane pyrophosphatase
MELACLPVCLSVCLPGGCLFRDACRALRTGTGVAGALILVILGFIVPVLGFPSPLRLYTTAVIGLVSGAAIGTATEYATSGAYYPVQVPLVFWSLWV